MLIEREMSWGRIPGDPFASSMTLWIGAIVNISTLHLLRKIKRILNLLGIAFFVPTSEES